MIEKYAKIKLAFIASLALTASPSIVNASGIATYLQDPVVAGCVPGSQKGNEINTSSWHGKENVRVQREGYQFSFERTVGGITHTYEYDDCTTKQTFIPYSKDTPPALKKPPTPPKVSGPPEKKKSPPSYSESENDPIDEMPPIGNFEDQPMGLPAEL